MGRSFARPRSPCAPFPVEYTVEHPLHCMSPHRVLSPRPPSLRSCSLALARPRSPSFALVRRRARPRPPSLALARPRLCDITSHSLSFHHLSTFGRSGAEAGGLALTLRAEEVAAVLINPRTRKPYVRGPYGKGGGSKRVPHVRGIAQRNVKRSKGTSTPNPNHHPPPRHAPAPTTTPSPTSTPSPALDPASALDPAPDTAPAPALNATLRAAIREMVLVETLSITAYTRESWRKPTAVGLGMGLAMG
jgi:hypothetical protein